MKTRRLFIAIALLLAAAQSPASVSWEERKDWVAFFKAHAAEGTIAVLDQRGETQARVYDKARAGKRLPPASTFKIPHALFALDAGVVRDEFQVFPWDGKERQFEVWNQDQDLRSSMRNSVVWVYEWIAAELGADKAGKYLQGINYGNADPAGDTNTYWIDGKLRITALEQINFLQRLYRNALPFRIADQRLVKDVMIVEAGKNWILRAKTGWADPLGWWVGWVEWPQGPVFFALNIDTPNGIDDLPKRQAIVRDVLRSIQALPAEPAPDK